MRDNGVRVAFVAVEDRKLVVATRDEVAAISRESQTVRSEIGFSGGTYLVVLGCYSRVVQSISKRQRLVRSCMKY